MSQLRILILVIVSTVLLQACSNDGSTDAGKDGTAIDSTIYGLSYSTATYSGNTDANGHFRYDEGESVTFHIGDIVLGTANGAAVITPIEMVAGQNSATDPTVTNIARLVQSLDDDADLTNGITITEQTRNAALGITLDVNITPANFETNNDLLAFLAVTTNGPLRTAFDAQTHLLNTLDLLFIPLPGSWTTTNTLTRSTCPGEQIGIPQQYPVSFQKSGATVTYTLADEFSSNIDVLGNTEGSHIVFGSYDINEDGGLTTVTSTDLVMHPDGQTITGTDTWSWTDGSVVCDGDAMLSFSKI